MGSLDDYPGCHALASVVAGKRFDSQMGRADGIEVTAEDQAAWEAAVAAFEKARRLGIGKPAFSLVGGVVGEPVEVIGARECGLGAYGAVLN